MDGEGRAGAFGALAMAGHEIGMEVCFDDVGDAQTQVGGGIQVDLDVELEVHHGGDAIGPDHVGCVGQAAQVKLFEKHGFPNKCVLGATRRRIG